MIAPHGDGHSGANADPALPASSAQALAAGWPGTPAAATGRASGPAVLPLQMVFFFNALALAVWFPRIPDVKAALDLDLFVLSICFFMMPFGTLLGFTAAAALSERFGTRSVCRWAGSAFPLLFIMPALATSAVQLGAVLFVAGIGIAQIEVAMNTAASQFETDTGRRVMSRCHGFWSIGSVAGAAIGSTLAAARLPVAAQQVTLEVAVAVATFWWAGRMAPLQSRTPASLARFVLPGRAVLGLCLVPLGALLLEGAMFEWSAIFMREDLGLSPGAAGFGFTTFALAMAASRLSGDLIADRLGPRTVLIGSCVLAATGILGFSLAGGLTAALPFAALLGLGIGNVYPLTISVVGKLPHGRPERNIAALTLIAFCAFLVGPPLIGTLGSAIGLPLALTVLTPFGIYPLWLILSGRATFPTRDTDAGA